MFRKLFLLTSFVLVFAFAFSTMAMASDIAFYIGQWNTDGWYDESQFQDVETIITETGHLFRDIQQFDDTQFDAFGVWVDERTNDGKMDIIWLNGCTPSILYPNPNEQPDGSRAEKWLDGGNMIINVGDWFAYCTYEGGPRGGEGRGGDNGGGGAANILDLSSGIIFGADGTQLTVTPTGKEYLPSLNDPAKTDRPVSLAAVEAPWEVAAIFASPGGTDDPAAEAHADPVVIHNTETDGYVAFINQASGGPDGWIDDRGLTCAELIGNWVNSVIGLVDMEIPFAMQPPVIDGETDGIWAIASTQSFVPLEDPADGSGTWQVLYDEENLYVIVDVTDDSLQNDSSSSWQDDSVEVYFDGGNTKLSTPLSGDDHQYTFGWTADDIQGTNITGYTDGIEQAQVTTDTGWRIEIKMPWLSIQGLAPQAGDLIGIDCYYNDDDDGGDSREGKMLSISTVEGWNDASQWGTAILAVAPEPVDPGTDGLVAYYALDNDANDSSGNGNDGTLNGTAASWIPDGGMIGGALSFDGTASNADRVEIPTAGISVAAGTIAMWGNLRPDPQAPDTRYFFGHTTIPPWSDRIQLYMDNADTNLDLGLGDSHNRHKDIMSLTTETWYHVTLTWDGGNYVVYVNGVEMANGSYTGLDTLNMVADIGNDGRTDDTGRTEAFNGLLDEVALYNRALSDDEVLYLAGYRPAPSPVGHWTLDESDGTIILDSSGNGNDGTIVGNPTMIDGVVGGALEFHGLGAAGGGGDYIDCGNDASLDIPGPISIALWIKPGADDPEGQGTTTAPMAKAMSGINPWNWQVRYGWNSPQPYMAFTFNTSPRAWAYVGQNLVRNEWAHIACSHDGETLKCYLNGVETDSTPMGEIATGEAPVLIGSDGWGCDWIGAIDDVRIYNVGLSEAEILDLAGF